MLLTKVYGSILEIFTAHSVVSDELLDSFYSLNICLLLNCLEVKLWWCPCPLYLLYRFRCFLFWVCLIFKTFFRFIQWNWLTWLFLFWFLWISSIMRFVDDLVFLFNCRHSMAFLERPSFSRSCFCHAVQILIWSKFLFCWLICLIQGLFERGRLLDLFCLNISFLNVV